MNSQTTLTRLPGSSDAGQPRANASVRETDDPRDVVGAPTITLYVSDERANESEGAFRSLETVGLAFSIAPADDKQVRAEWGGRVFGGASGVELLAANLRSFRDAVAKLDGPVGDPRLKERAADRYRQQLQEARVQFDAIVRASCR